jgi:hypothetical protein
VTNSREIDCECVENLLELGVNKVNNPTMADNVTLGELYEGSSKREAVIWHVR